MTPANDTWGGRLPESFPNAKSKMFFASYYVENCTKNKMLSNDILCVCVFVRNVSGFDEFCIADKTRGSRKE